MARIQKLVAIIVVECFFGVSISPPIIADVPNALAMPSIASETPAAPGDAAGLAKYRVTPESDCSIEIEGARIDIPAGAVDNPIIVTILPITAAAGMNDGMANVTAGATAYRFGPHGTRFRKPVHVSLPFDSEILGSETALSNTFTYFWNERAGMWERLKRISLDRERAVVTSETTHFTDMINATLTLPEGPSPVQFDVNSIKNLEAANPSAGVPMPEGLEAGSRGSASFQIALRLPAGRGGAMPRLALSYSSDLPNGLMGRGFDIPVPAVTTDTEFGLPKYDGTDTYKLCGEELAAVGPEGDGVGYRPLREGGFQRIVLRDRSGENYWEVTDKSGSIAEYGRGEGWIGPSRTDRGRIFAWYLTKTRDPFGNTMEYVYGHDAANAYTYLSEVRYSGYEGGGPPETGAYLVRFTLEDRDDRRMDSRGAFMSKLSRRLDRVDVYCGEDAVRSYTADYEYNEFGQSQLVRWTENDGAGNPFYAYAFDYYGLDPHLDGYMAFEEEKDFIIGDADKELGSTATSSVGADLFTGIEFFLPIPFIGIVYIASLGFTVGGGGSSTQGINSFIDLNGDGLPDMVWKSGDTLYSYLNGNGSFLETGSVSGIDGPMEREDQVNVSIGFTAGIKPVSVTTNLQFAWNDAETAFSDVNADGFVDFLRRNGAQFGLNNGVAGALSFIPTGWAMTGESSPPLPDENADAFQKAYFRQEPVRKWKAYRSGTVAVTEEAGLVNAGSASLDGVRLFTYRPGGTDVISLSRGGPDGASASAYPVSRGESLYFRMETGNAEHGDDADWRIGIGYTSVRFFEDLENAALFLPPEISPNQLPFGDSRLSPIYDPQWQESSVVYVRRQEWEESAGAAVYEALLDHALFVPRRISKADMDLLIGTFQGEPNVEVTATVDGEERIFSLPPANLLLRGYRLESETQTLYRVDGSSDQTMMERLPMAFTTAQERRRVGSLEWIDGAAVVPTSVDGRFELRKDAAATPVPARIGDDEQAAVPGETVWGAGILLDRLWSGGETPAVIESAWLRNEGQGAWKLFVRDADGEREETPPDLSVAAIGTDGLLVSYTDGGIMRQFLLSGKSMDITEISAGAYEGPVTGTVMAGETVSAYCYETVPAAAMSAALAALNPADTAFLLGCYTADGGDYRLLPSVTDVDLRKALSFLEPPAVPGDSIFDVLAGDPDAAVRFIRLEEDEYDRFILQHPQMAACFSSYSEGAGVYYCQKRGLDAAQRTALHEAMFSFRRDAELFPYFDVNAQTGARTLKSGLDGKALGDVRDVMERSGLFFFSGMRRSLIYGSSAVLPVSSGTLPDGASEEQDAPRGTIAAEAGAIAGVVEVLEFDAQERTAVFPRYLHVFDSYEDFSTQNLARNIDPENLSTDPYLGCNGDIENFHGGVMGWYYGVWTGYYAWDATKIGAEPPRPAEGETASPPYFIAMDPNRDPQSGEPAIAIDGKGSGTPVPAESWIGNISTYQEQTMDDAGRAAGVTYAYAAFMDGQTVHPGRNGGEAYYRLPLDASGGGTGSLAFIRSGKSTAVDVNGGFNLGFFGGNITFNSGTTWETQGLFDLNGDRYPDLVDFKSASNGGFHVRPGTGSGFGPEQDYSTPFSCVSVNANHAYGFGASIGVSTGGIQARYPLDNQPYFTTVAGGGGSGGINGTLGSSYQTEGFFDMNGDGLPDHVQREGTGGYIVALNTGTGTMSGQTDWGSGMSDLPSLFTTIGDLTTVPSGLTQTGNGSFGASFGASLDGLVVGVGASASFTGTVGQTFSSLTDVNGDGLPDQVVKLKDEDFFRVKFNLGDRFSESEVRLYRPQWAEYDPADLQSKILSDLGVISSNLSGVEMPDGAPNTGLGGMPDASGNPVSGDMNPFAVDDVLNYTCGTSFNLGGSLTARYPFTLVALTLRFGLNGTWAGTSANLRFTDITGDGLPDHVMKLPYENFIRVKANSMGRVGLLRRIGLPQGGSYEIEYGREGNTVSLPQSRWVLSAVTTNDGVGHLSTDRGEHGYRVEYSYPDGGYYDRKEREFWGFGRVVSAFADGSRRSVWYYNRDFYRRGMEYRREVSGPAGGVPMALLSRTLTTVEQQSEGYYGGKEVIFCRAGSRINRLYDPQSGRYTESETVYRYDRDLGQGDYGNIAYIEDRGDTSVIGDELFAWITYAELDGYFKQHPSSIRVEGSGGALPASLRKREGAYGGHGELTLLTQYESAAVGRSRTMTYDRYGNLESIQDPRGARTRWTYDDQVHSHVVTTTKDNPLLGGPVYESRSAWDIGLGVETSRTDVAGETMSFVHDGFGRLTEVWSPYDTGAEPAVRYRYFTGSVPWYAMTGNKISHDPEDDETLDTILSVDGLGRSLQAAKESEVLQEGARRTGWNLSGAVAYDAKGRAAAEGQPMFMEGPGLPGLASMELPTLKGYDCLDRLTSVTLPGKATSSMSYFIRNGRYVERMTDPKGNVAEKALDVRGNTVEVGRLDAAGSVLTVTAYEYDALGQILTVLDQRGNAVRSAYDMMGRRVRFESPDAGVVEYEFDAAGNAARKIDSVLRRRGQSIRYEYDGLNRLTRVDYPRSTDVQYTYGAPGAAFGGAGRVVSCTDESGTVSFRYGKLGETEREERTINRLTPLAPDETAILSFVSDYLGRMQSVTYPDGETVTYGYDNGGQVKSAIGVHYGIPTAYVQDIGYDKFGQRVYIKYGNMIETSYAYDRDRRWLDGIETRTSWNAVYQSMGYSFDEVGNVLGVANAADTCQVDYIYEYDALNQLTYAEGKIGMTDYTSRYTQDFGFDAIGNLTSKISTLATTPPRTIGASLDYGLEYAYYPGKAHQAERVGDMWYRYDANGNMVEERQGGHSQAPLDEPELALVGDVRVANRGFGLSTGDPSGPHVYERTFAWDEENRLKRSADAAATVDYRYGADGERAVKYSSRGETLYFDSLWQMTTDYPDLRQSKHVYVGQTRIATRCNIKGYTDAGYETLNTYYFHPDHLGSAQLVTDYAGEKYEHMEYTPYGELWVEEVSEPVSKTPFRFTGKEMDEETGLYYYGARYLNPRTSMWISADPAMEEYLPKAGGGTGGLPGMGGVFNTFNLAAYHYAGNNPVNYVDPNGREDSASGGTNAQIKTPFMMAVEMGLLSTPMLPELALSVPVPEKKDGANALPLFNAQTAYDIVKIIQDCVHTNIVNHDYFEKESNGWLFDLYDAVKGWAPQDHWNPGVFSAGTIASVGAILYDTYMHLDKRDLDLIVGFITPIFTNQAILFTYNNFADNSSFTSGPGIVDKTIGIKSSTTIQGNFTAFFNFNFTGGFEGGASWNIGGISMGISASRTEFKWKIGFSH